MVDRIFSMVARFAVLLAFWACCSTALGQDVVVADPSEFEAVQPSYYASQPEFEMVDQQPIQTVLDVPSLVIPEDELSLSASEEVILAEECDCGECEECEDKLDIGFGDWLGYNSPQSDTTWLFGSGDDLGMFSFENYPNLKIGKDSVFSLGMGLHFVNGPIATDLPPRLYDLVFAYQRRTVLSPQMIYDLRVGVGAFTDFEGSVRKGMRFPGHFVGYYEWHPWFISVLGVEMLDRDDVSVLPVAGFVWRPNDNLVIDAVFPRPKIQHKILDNTALYLGGELGGGTWAIEREQGTNDNVTYRDFRLILGIHDFDDDDSALEFGWAFARKLEYRSGLGDYHADDTFLLRWRRHY